jgi:NTE family protein
VRIEDLPVAFTAVATDLTTFEERWFREGPLDAAIRASVALPGFMTPVVIDGRLLADGGLLNPLPLAATASAGADLTVAVAVSGRRGPPDGAPVRSRRTGRLAARRVAHPVVEELPPGLRLLDVVELSLEAVRAGAARQALAAHSPDVLVTVPRSTCGTLDFHRAAEVIALGRRLAAEALDRAEGTAPVPEVDRLGVG